MPDNDYDLQKLHSDIRLLQSITDRMLDGSEGFPALNRNIRRIQAGLKMLELDICDWVDLEKLSTQ
ncbi:MAG: hypothetical protein AMJ54_01130 [Deltaproteobacteria bacterium SG8_13]|nr:MAG: hypothetical protein AMJ54_01130 [Deltaproteobacteria bacterium SG8_13]